MSRGEANGEASATRVDGRTRRSNRPQGDLSVPFSVADTELIPGTVEEVIDRDMHRRMTAFAPFVVAIIGVVGFSSFLLGGDEHARNIMLGAMVACFATSIWMMRRLRAHVHVSNFELA